MRREPLPRAPRDSARRRAERQPDFGARRPVFGGGGDQEPPARSGSPRSKSSDEIEEYREQIRLLRRDLDVVTHSLTWRLTQRAAQVVRRAVGQDPLVLAQRLTRRRGSAPATTPATAPGYRVPDFNGQYERYRSRLPASPKPPRHGPLVSIVVPTYNTSPWMLYAMRRSVENQTYTNWEICIADDASTDTSVVATLKEWAAADPQRVRIVALDRNVGISGASQAALDLATGDYVALLDHDDELTPDALAEVVRALNENPDADFLYSDEDKVGLDGTYYDAFFKPAWSPDLMLSMMYTGHLAVFRRSVLLEAGGFRPGYDGSQDYDLVLRVTERTDRIYHLPKVLYHWRAVPGSAAASTEAKPYAYDAARRAIEDALRRRGIGATVEAKEPGFYRVRYEVNDPPAVAVLVPTNGSSMPTLRRCIESVLRLTDYPNYRVVILDNSVESGEVETYVERLADPRVVRFAATFKPFNFSMLMNFGAAVTDEPLLLLLNDDTEVLGCGWMTAMVELALQPGIGAVGAKLVYPDGLVQHAGVVVGIGAGAHRVAVHAHKYFPEWHGGYAGFMLAIKNYSAVTAACLMVRRAVFDEVGGFDDVRLAVAFNDVDFCLKIRERGYRNVVTPYAKLNHYESLSRGHGLDHGEILSMVEKWGDRLDDDPYYNPNFAINHPDYADFGLE